ncbi:MAG: TonB-dependent receptor [Flavobacteriales bacterium]|jgi:iron complex outermembrane receptor protein|nr:TonB-dependent receptor [Flavobacteriales bacterium]
MKRFFRTILLLLLAAPAMAAPANPAAGKTTLSGIVTDKASGKSIPGAEVYFPDLHTGAVTDLDGNYVIQDLPTTKALVKVSMVGYATFTATIDLATETTRDFVLSESVTEMHDVVVTGSAKATELKRDPVPIAMVSRRYLRENASTNAIETLNKVPGVSTVSTGPNVSKPYIRGLGGNRVLTLFDGVRQEGQQWGEEHGVEVDQFLIDRVEVVKGPASLMYGSDALAGVINLLPAPPVPAGSLNGSVLGAYDTNNKGISSSVNLDGNNGNLLYGGRFSGKIASDYRNRYDGEVYGTKYNEKDLSAYLGVNRSWGFTRLKFSIYDNLQEVPDGSRDSTSRRFTYQTAEEDEAGVIVPEAVLNSYTIADLRQHVQYYRATAISSFNFGDSRLTSKFGFSRSIRREYEHPQRPDLPGLHLILNTLTYDLKYHFAELNGWEPTLGVNGMVQANNAAGGTELVVPSYRQFDIGPFLHTKKTLGKWDVSGGVRYDIRNFSNDAMFTRMDPTTGFDVAAGPSPGDTSVVKQFDSYSHIFNGASGSLGAAWNMNERLTLKANIGRGYRAPSVAETSAKGVHPGTGLQQLGDENLRPEFNLQEDLGLFYDGTHVTVSAEVFNNTVSNYVYNEKLASVSGGDSLFMQDGQAYPVFKFKQTTARLYGGEFSVDVHPHPLDRLHFENTLSFVFAENKGGDGALITDSTKYLPLIPPLHTNSELRWDMPRGAGSFKRLFVKVGVQMFATQDRFFAAYATETRTPGYTLLDAGFGGDVVNKAGRTLFSFTVLGSNLTDVGYQSNMSRLKYFDDYPVNGTGRSGIYNMGRNVSIKVVVPFDLKRNEAKPVQ